MFDPLDHFGPPVDQHSRHWHELDLEPVDARATDAYTRCRITTMEAVAAIPPTVDRVRDALHSVV